MLSLTSICLSFDEREWLNVTRCIVWRALIDINLRLTFFSKKFCNWYAKITIFSLKIVIVINLLKLFFKRWKIFTIETIINVRKKLKRRFRSMNWWRICLKQMKTRLTNENWFVNFSTIKKKVFVVVSNTKNNLKRLNVDSICCKLNDVTNNVRYKNNEIMNWHNLLKNSRFEELISKRNNQWCIATMNEIDNIINWYEIKNNKKLSC